MWPLPRLSTHLFEKAVNQLGFAKENKKNSVWQLLNLPGICTHAYLPVIDFMTQITIKKNEHKDDLLLDTLALNEQTNRGGGEIIFLLLPVLFF